MAFIAYYPMAYYVVLNDGTVERLDRKEWIEGPYEFGGRLNRTDGEQLSRVLNWFARDFRGNASSRKDEKFNIRDIAFDFERFFKSQYFLSPNIGHTEMVDGEPQLVADYPEFELTGAASHSDGTLLTYTGDGGTEHVYADGYVLGGLYAVATGLTAEAKVQVMNGQQIIDEFALSPEEPELTKWYSDAVAPAPLAFRLVNAAEFADANGELRIHCTEQQAYKPEIHDAYLVLRMSSTHGDVLRNTDTRGIDVAKSTFYSDTYFQHGMILNAAASQPPEDSFGVNGNPVYDAARRLTRDNTRIVRRQEFIGYEVVGGKSVLYFKRYVLGSNNQKVDAFHHLAPQIDPIESGKIREQVVYIVRGFGTVTYNEQTYSDGQTFLGEKGVTIFEADPDTAVHEYNGIYHTAPPRGWSNEWLMFTQLKTYHWSESSVWKPSNYSDYFAWNNRCHFYSPTITKNQNVDLLQHFGGGVGNFQMFPLLAPEAPSGYNYAGSSNERPRYFSGTDEQRRRFYQSCQVYQPDVEIQSATVEFEGTEEVVKLTMKGRLPHTDEAPASIGRNVGGWDVDALRNEPYRTMENGLREYLVNQSLGENCVRGKSGDTGYGSDIWSQPDEPYGACYPHFFFTRLIPRPYDDDNDTLEQSHDTLAIADTLIQMEHYLRAMCEGFVDGETTKDYGCEMGIAALFDYTFENLCFDAFGGKWLNTLAAVVRDDKPQGFGPLPNTILYAEIFNQLAKAVNKLTKARLMLPMSLECRTENFNGSKPVSVDWPDDAECLPGSVAHKATWSGAPPSPDTLIGETDWTECSSTRIGGISSGGLSDECSGNQYTAVSSKLVYHFRFKLTDPDALLAIPDGIRGLAVDEEGHFSRNTGFMGLYSESKTTLKKVQVATQDEAEGCCFNYQRPCPGLFWDAPAGIGWHWDVEETVIAEDQCGLFLEGKLEPEDPPPSDFYVALNNGALCDPRSSHQMDIKFLGAETIPFITVPLNDPDETEVQN